MVYNTPIRLQYRCFSVLKTHKFGFDFYAALLFAAVMIPNIIWAFVPAPKDMLRIPSATPELDIVATVFQVLAIASLVIIVYKNADRRNTLLSLTAYIPTAAYFVCWIVYYCGAVSYLLVVLMAILPCAAFIVYAALRRNFIAIVITSVFLILHLVSTIINFFNALLYMSI